MMKLITWSLSLTPKPNCRRNFMKSISLIPFSFLILHQIQQFKNSSTNTEPLAIKETVFH